MTYVRFLPRAPLGIGFWALAMGCNSLRLTTYLCVPILGQPVAIFIAESLQALVAILLLVGTLAFAGKHYLRGPFVALALAACVWSALTTFVHADFLLRTIPLYLLGGGAMIVTGVILFRSGRAVGSAEESFTGVAFFAWGIHKLDFPFLRPVEWFAPWGFTIAQALSMIVAVGLVLAALRRLQEEVQSSGRAIEQNHQEQGTLNSLLRISLENLPLKQKLEKSLDIVLAVPWLGVLPKGAVFVTEITGDQLNMTAERGLPEPLLARCDKVRFGECLCGRAALTKELQHAHCVDERHEIRYPGLTPHGHYNVPIVSNQRTLGVLLLYLPEGHQRNEGEVVFLQSVASILAGMIERHEADEALQKSQSNLAKAQGIARLGSWELDLKSGELYWSDEVFRIFHFEPADFDGTRESFYRCIHPEDRSLVRHITDKAIEDKKPYTLDYRIVLPGGEERTLHEEAELEFDDSGRATILRGTVQDVTERYAAERALYESEQLLRAVLDNSPAIIAIRDADGRYQLVNSAYERMFGVTNEDICGKFPRDIMPSEFADDLKDYDQEVIKTGKPMLHEHKAALQFGGDTLLSARFPIRDAAGKLIGVGSIATDITEHKLLEDQLRQSQKMEAIGQLTGGIAHDFNNLLAVISGNLELAAESVGEESTAFKLINKGIEASIRGAELTNRLLAYSRKQALQPTTIDINAHLDGMIDLLRRTLGENIEVDTHLDDGLWMVVVDRSQVENAILNLAVNARDAMPKGGRLSIRTANVPLTDPNKAAELDVAPGDYVRIVVTDTGGGMDEAVLEHAFEPFYTTKGVGMGTGLGLSMVYGFAKQSGGNVEIESVPGEGTTITLYLPRSKQGPLENAREPASAVPSGDGETILVVEDDPDVRLLAEAMLDDLGYRTLSAPDGDSALSILKSPRRIDLLLSDVVLSGGMSGPELVRAARDLRPEIDVLFMSGYAKDAALSGGIFESEAELLQKPFRKVELAEKVHNALAATARS